MKKTSTFIWYEHTLKLANLKLLNRCLLDGQWMIYGDIANCTRCDHSKGNSFHHIQRVQTYSIILYRSCWHAGSDSFFEDSNQNIQDVKDSKEIGIEDNWWECLRRHTLIPVCLSQNLFMKMTRMLRTLHLSMAVVLMMMFEVMGKSWSRRVCLSRRQIRRGAAKSRSQPTTTNTPTIYSYLL